MMNRDMSGAAAGFALFAMGVGGLLVLAFIAFTVWCYWRIAEKAGYNAALSLLMFVPGANLVMIAIFAFSRWPIEERLAAALSSHPGSTVPPPAPPPGTSVMQA